MGGLFLFPLAIAHSRHSRQHGREGSRGAVAVCSHGDHF